MIGKIWPTLRMGNAEPKKEIILLWQRQRDGEFGHNINAQLLGRRTFQRPSPCKFPRRFGPCPDEKIDTHRRNLTQRCMAANLASWEDCSYGLVPLGRPKDVGFIDFRAMAPTKRADVLLTEDFWKRQFQIISFPSDKATKATGKCSSPSVGLAFPAVAAQLAGVPALKPDGLPVLGYLSPSRTREIRLL